MSTTTGANPRSAITSALRGAEAAMSTAVSLSGTTWAPDSSGSSRTAGNMPGRPPAPGDDRAVGQRGGGRLQVQDRVGPEPPPRYGPERYGHDGAAPRGERASWAIPAALVRPLRPT